MPFYAGTKRVLILNTGGGGSSSDLTYSFTYNGDAFTFGGAAFTYGAP